VISSNKYSTRLTYSALFCFTGSRAHHNSRKSPRCWTRVLLTSRRQMYLPKSDIGGWYVSDDVPFVGNIIRYSLQR
jgi:hypothetical protein